MKKKIITGLELASYLQMLAFDKQTCMLRVRQHDMEGMLCMKDGCPLDAQTRKKNASEVFSQFREDAIIEMLRWKMPEIEFLSLDKPIKKKINKSLEFLLLESSRLQDEAEKTAIEESLPSEEQQLIDDMSFNGMPMLIEHLAQNEYVVAYLVLDQHGSIIAKKDEDNILDADFLSFVQFTFNSYNPEILPDAASGRNINFTLKNNRKIMIYAFKINVLGMIIDSRIACDEVEKNIIPLLSGLQTLEPNMIASVPS